LYEDFNHAGPVSQLPPAAMPTPLYQRVSARGVYDSGHQFLLDNMTHEGQAGMHVLTPLLLPDGSAVLVNRGWVPFGATRDSLPDIEVSPDPRAVGGRLDQLPRPLIRLEAEPLSGWPRLISYPRMEDLAAALGRKLRPQLILLDAQAPAGYVREWRVPGTTPDRHLGYAIQWFAFAATALAIWFAQSLQPAGES
jgi:surfeit locus 1 family protein